MTITVSTFRASMPEFADPGTYPEPTVNFYIGLSGKLLDVNRWEDLFDYGQTLFVAHHLVLAAQRTEQASFGGLPGEARGPLSSKSIDKVSVSYDTGSAAEDGAGFYNSTSYGQELYRLVRMIGAGPIQVGVPLFDSMSAVATAYAGPYLG